MHKHISKIAGLFFAITVLGSCVRVGELREDVQTVQLGEAEVVKVELRMGAGELRLHGGAAELMKGYFEYNVDRWKPEVDYSVFGRRGILEVRQGKTEGVPIGNTKNRWDIGLNDDVPLEVVINFGAGEGNLDFKDMQLRYLDIDMGVGELNIDLSGEWEQDLEVDIDGGIGSAKIYLPKNIGVRVKVDGAIGSVKAPNLNKDGNVYTNDVYSHTDISIDVKIDAGIGSIDLKLN